MQLAFWPLLRDEDLPAAVRQALAIANFAASSEVADQARRRAACGLMDTYGLTPAEAAELMAVEAARLPCVFRPTRRAA